MGIAWQGFGVKEVGVLDRDVPEGPRAGETVVEVDPGYFRPTEVDSLLGDAAKARAKLGWRPRVSFPELVREMVAGDLKDAQRERDVKNLGYHCPEHFE